MTLLFDVQFALQPPSSPDLGTLRSWAEHTLDSLGLAGETRVLGLRVVGDEESCRLNRQYRGIGRATNVLAFPPATEGWPPDEPLPLGDIVICAPVLAQEATEQGKPLEAHWCHMLVHGILHLIGHDHHDDSTATRMEAQEARILGDLGFTDPYAADCDPC